MLKPAELTPLSALRLAELALEAGIPEGVINVLVGKGSIVGTRLVEHPDVAKIGFTGSTEVGQQVMSGAAGRSSASRSSSAASPANVVFADADLERAAASAPYAVFDNAGQDCCARSRILVERSAYDRFAELLIERDEGDEGRGSRGRRDGDGPADLGRAPRDGGRRSSTASRSTAARRRMARASGTRATIVEASNDDRVAREEVFGPVAALIPFEDEADADPARERHAVRALRLDLDARRRAGAPRRAGDRHRRPQRQLELVRRA